MKHRIIALGAFASLFACDSKKTDQEMVTDAGKPRSKNANKWGIVSSTMQLVRASVDPLFCKSGWTKLTEELNARGVGHLPPLQKTYVNRFETLPVFSGSATNAFGLVKNSMSTFRLSLVWPCWLEDAEWRRDISNMIVQLKRVGWKIEITLLHHDSYPAEFHNSQDLSKSGWGHSDAPSAFVNYTNEVMLSLGPLLTPGTRVYLANEPIQSLYEGYLNSEGKWPPGGKRAGKALASALLGLRQALKDAAAIIKRAGFRPAIAANIRPLEGDTTRPGAATLNYFWNWWLLDALISGCIDNDFSGVCIRRETRAVDTIGVTFYGKMLATTELVTLGLPQTPGTPLAIPYLDFEPNSALFEQAMKAVLTRYQNEQQLEIGVGEIGFSASLTATQATWLQEYKEIVYRLNLPFAQLHTLFESAEFSRGDWVFHLIDDCTQDYTCHLTPWGEEFVRLIWD